MAQITIEKIKRQLQADLIGKDSYRGVTLTYAWLANQFGHFALGFIPVILISTALKLFHQIQDPVLTATLFTIGFWFVFESINFLGPLLRKRRSSSKLFYKSHRVKYIFQPPWFNIAFDTFTDLCYFWIGSLVASELLHHHLVTVLLIFILFGLLFLFFRHWYLIRMFLQSGLFPFQFRLSLWDYPISEKNVDMIRSLKKEKKNYHLLISGDHCCGRTSLSVALASEYSMKGNSVFYTTAIKLLPHFFDKHHTTFDSRNMLWNWREASMLVIDDINPGYPVNQEILSPSIFLNCIDTQTENNELNRHILCNKKVIWVLGTGISGGHITDEWKKMLVNIGVQEEDIFVIHLTSVQDHYIR